MQSQYEAARSVNEKQLMLYYGIGKYISLKSRKGYWGKGAIDAISERLDKELPGLRGFSARNLRYMRTFYEEWATLDDAPVENAEIFDLAQPSAKLPEREDGQIWQTLVPNSDNDFIKAWECNWCDDVAPISPSMSLPHLTQKGTAHEEKPSSWVVPFVTPKKCPLGTWGDFEAADVNGAFFGQRTQTVGDMV